MKTQISRTLSNLALFFLGAFIFFIAGCKSRPQPAKYGGPPATKYGIKPTSYIKIDFKINKNNLLAIFKL